MAKRAKYEELINNVLDLIGGKDNVSFFTHCVTRLRFNLKDRSLLEDEKIQKLPGVIGSQWVADQYQIIIGQEVSDVYNMICEKHGFTKEKSVKENLEVKSNKKFSAGAILSAISGCITPLIPMLVGGGMIKVFILILSQLGVLSNESGTYVILNMVSAASTYFLPVAIGYTGSKKFGVNTGLGLLLGGILIHPTLLQMVSDGAAISIFGVPIAANSYGSSIFPMILTMFVAGYVERFFAKYSPKVVRSIVEPLGTLIIMVPLMLCVLAPLGSYLGVYLGAAIMWIYDTLGPLECALFAAFSPYLVMTGMHLCLDPYTTQSFAMFGKEGIIGPAKYVRDFNQGIACLVVALKTKDMDLRTTALSCAVTAIFGGVTEPALFGINLKYKKPLYSAIIGGFFGGLYAGFAGTARYSYGPGGLLGLPVFISEDPMNLINQVIACLIGAAVTFIAGMIIVKKEDLEAADN